MLGLLKTADMIRRRIAGVLEPYGVTPQQYNVLRILRGAGVESLATLAIRDRMIEQAPGITRLLDRLEARGWVQRVRPATDRRQVLCGITAAGRDLLAQLDQPISEVDQRALEALTDEEVGVLTPLLDKIRIAQQPCTRKSEHPIKEENR